MTPEAIKMHEKAKIALLDKKATFFASIVYSLKLAWTDKVPTAGVNLTHLYINPDWYLPLTTEEKAGLLCHEAMHIALDHLARRNELQYDSRKYNIAGDYVINNHLVKEGFELPKDGLVDSKYNGMTTEQVYNILPEEPDCDFDEDLLPEEDGSSSPVEARERMKEILVRAKTAAEMDGTIGNVPGEITRRINELINPTLDWRTVLDRFLQDKANIDYSWRIPNRRFFPSIYLPSLDGVKLGHIGVGIDLSGSITDDDLKAFLSEIYYLYTSLNPERLTIIGWDTQLSDIFEIEDAEDIKTLKFTGGGGTEISSLMHWINDNKPLGFIVFTDGYYEEYRGEVDSDLIFMIKDNDEYISNIGETIYYAS